MHKEKNNPEYYDKVMNKVLKQEKRTGFIFKYILECNL